MIENLILGVIVILVIIVLSSLPLYLAVKTLGGKTTIFKTFFVMLGVGMLSILIQFIFPLWGVLISWLLLIFIFKEVFRLSILKAFFVWILWIVFVAFFIFLFTIFGLSFFTISLL